ncbi:hypothetical protein Ddc_18820 [Ditylenchus destructor]|nr:hypothetical protein Ddc_18820 [Ditylenchus destructor]
MRGADRARARSPAAVDAGRSDHGAGTSSAAFVPARACSSPPAETPLIARLDRRVAEIMNLPVSHGEGLQILHYPEGAGSAPHFDFLVPSNAANQTDRPQRAARQHAGDLSQRRARRRGNRLPGGRLVWCRRSAATRSTSSTRTPRASWITPPCTQQRGHARREVGGATKWMRERPFVSA